MDALADAIAPKQWRWSGHELLVMGAGVLLVSLVLVAAALSQVVQPRGAPFEFVADARANWSAGVAIVVAREEREGSAAEALRRLESAKSETISDATSRRLAAATGGIAIEFERQHKYQDAGTAWYLLSLIAQDLDYVWLAAAARERVRVLNDAPYTSSALKQVTVPSSLQTPSSHQ
jgi:hypothetical protein